MMSKMLSLFRGALAKSVTDYDYVYQVIHVNLKKINNCSRIIRHKFVQRFKDMYIALHISYQGSETALYKI